MEVVRVRGKKFNGEWFKEVDDFLTVESALQIRLNGQSFTITMRTPGHDTELTRGLLFTEDVAPENSNPQITLKRDDKNEVTVACCHLKEVLENKSARSILSSSSCGLCGKVELSELELEGIQLTPSAPLDVNLIPDMFRQMHEYQENFKKSGGCHAAAAFDIQGNLINSFEDIGRHNAVDKVIGGLLLTNKLTEAECLLVSGRVSYEIVAKAAKASIPYLIAVSAPSSLSVEMAGKAGMTLIAFCRDGRATVYSHVQHVTHTEQYVH